MALISTTNGKFAAITQVHFLCLILRIAWYDEQVVVLYSLVTIASTIGAFFINPEAMFQLDDLSIWLYILGLYIMATIATAIITRRMRLLIGRTKQLKAYEDELIYMQQLEKKDQKHREFVHNMSHYFLAIGELARIENCDQIVSLVQELNGKMLIGENIIYSRNKVLNAILSEKKSEASEQQIQLDIYVEPILRLTRIRDIDLVAMMGNLLDNALEAAGQCEGEKRNVSLWTYMENDGNVCVVKIVNYFSTPRIQHKSGFVSTKENRKEHGIGIKSVGSMVRKYGGYLQSLVEGDTFTSILILPVED